MRFQAAEWRVDNVANMESAIEFVLQVVDEKWLYEYGSTQSMDLIGTRRMLAMIEACNRLLTYEVDPPLTHEETILVRTLRSDMEITYVREKELNQPIPHTQEQPAPRLTKSTRPGYVYLIQSSTGYWKIGLSRVPVQRIDRLGVILPFDIEVQALIKTDDMYYLESELHIRFDRQRVRGEWFNLSDEDVAYIKSLAVNDE